MNVKFCVKTWYEFHLSALRKSFDLWWWQIPLFKAYFKCNLKGLRFMSYHWLFQSYRAKHFFVIFSKQFLGFFYYICDTKLIVILWPRILAGIWGVCHHQESKDLLRTDKWNSYHVLTQNLTFIADAIFQQFGYSTISGLLTIHLY